MSNQRRSLKKGFTLIELMVVIVIIGILAAIAIPKLFGMTAKAKASEVGPAAGTWSKLQQAFSTETAKAGNFKAIGYTAPGDRKGGDSEISETTNFEYTSVGDLASTYDNDGVDTTAAGWKATAKVPLNECKKEEGVWNAKFLADSNKVTEIEIFGSDGNLVNKIATGDCGSLTPQFGYLK